MFHRRIYVWLIGITLTGIYTCAYAQWNYPDSRIPRTKDGKPNLDTSNEIVSGMLITQNGQVVHPRVKDAMATTRESVAV